MKSGYEQNRWVLQGCDASILLDPTSNNTQVEKKAIALRGYDAANKIKAAVESVCPGVVSCADILAFAARDSAVVSGGFASFAMPSGRRDGVVSNFIEVLQNIPSPIFKLQELISNFANKGLSIDDLVTLSAAHSFGQAHCSFVNGRLYPTVDPTMNNTYDAALKTVCPAPGTGGGDPVVNNNRVTDPNVLSNQYYSNLVTGQVLFVSDQQLHGGQGGQQLRRRCDVDGAVRGGAGEDGRHPGAHRDGRPGQEVRQRRQ